MIKTGEGRATCANLLNDKRHGRLSIWISSKRAPNLIEDLQMAGRAVTASEGYWPKNRIDHNARRDITWKG